MISPVVAVAVVVVVVVVVGLICSTPGSRWRYNI